MKFFVRLFFTFYFAVFFTVILLFFLVPVFDASEICFSIGFLNIELSKKFSVLWFNIKRIYCLTCFLTFFIMVNSLYSILQLIFSSLANHHITPSSSPEKNTDLCVDIRKEFKKCFGFYSSSRIVSKYFSNWLDWLW